MFGEVGVHPFSMSCPLMDVVLGGTRELMKIFFYHFRDRFLNFFIKKTVSVVATAKSNKNGNLVVILKDGLILVWQKFFV